MKAVGGIGNGVFECVQELVGYMNLCYLRADDPELYRELFQTLGDVCLKIWERFLSKFGDSFCVLRFGDDLGFKSNTLLPGQDIKTLIIPQYQRIIHAVHTYHKRNRHRRCLPFEPSGYAGVHPSGYLLLPGPWWVCFRIRKFNSQLCAGGRLSHHGGDSPRIPRRF